MRRKFYVTCGTMKEIVLAENQLHACIKAFTRLDNPILIGAVFRVSERGFDNHDDDYLIETARVIQLLVLAAEADNDPPHEASLSPPAIDKAMEQWELDI